MCKHVVGIASIKGLFEIPMAAKTDLLGTKRKPGRPKKVKGALLVN